MNSLLYYIKQFIIENLMSILILVGTFLLSDKPYRLKNSRIAEALQWTSKKIKLSTLFITSIIISLAVKTIINKLSPTDQLKVLAIIALIILVKRTEKKGDKLGNSTTLNFNLKS